MRGRQWQAAPKTPKVFSRQSRLEKKTGTPPYGSVPAVFTE